MSGRKLLFLFLIITVTAGKAQKLMDTGGMAYSRNSVNTTVFRSNSVVSSGKYQYIAFYDQDGFIVLGQRKITEKNGSLKKPDLQETVPTRIM